MNLLIILQCFIFRLATPNPAYSFLNTIQYNFYNEATSDISICLDHDHELLKPHIISTWMPSGVGSLPGKRVIFAETQVNLRNFYYSINRHIQIQNVFNIFHSTIETVFIFQTPRYHIYLFATYNCYEQASNTKKTSNILKAY